MNSMLIGAYDLHVHAAPDLLPRKFDDFEMAERATASGMKGFALKSHFFCTAERAETVRKAYPGCNALGSITLNNSVGGINPSAVEIAARAGAKIVWFPTIDSEVERGHLSDIPREKLPYWASIVMKMEAEGIVSPAVSIAEAGKLRKDVYDVLDVMATHSMVLATGHLSRADTFLLLSAAHERGVERVIVTHVDFPSTFLSVQDQQRLINSGAFVEHCYTTPTTGKVSWDVVIEQIRGVGAEHVILTTDLGQPSGLFPDEGLADFAQRLLANGVSENEIETMLVRNPASLVE